jgi:hypothetical protein
MMICVNYSSLFNFLDDVRYEAGVKSFGGLTGVVINADFNFGYS